MADRVIETLLVQQWTFNKAPHIVAPLPWELKLWEYKYGKQIRSSPIYYASRTFVMDSLLYTISRERRYLKRALWMTLRLSVLLSMVGGFRGGARLLMLLLLILLWWRCLLLLLLLLKAVWRWGRLVLDNRTDGREPRKRDTVRRQEWVDAVVFAWT